MLDLPDVKVRVTSQIKSVLVQQKKQSFWHLMFQNQFKVCINFLDFLLKKCLLFVFQESCYSWRKHLKKKEEKR